MFVRGVLPLCLLFVCLLCVFGCVARERASHLSHTFTHVGTVDDGRPQEVNLLHPSVLFCLLPSLCVGWCLVVMAMVCVFVWCAVVCCVVGGVAWFVRTCVVGVCGWCVVCGGCLVQQVQKRGCLSELF